MQTPDARMTGRTSRQPAHKCPGSRRNAKRDQVLAPADVAPVRSSTPDGEALARACRCGAPRSSEHPSRCRRGHNLAGGDVGVHSRFQKENVAAVKGGERAHALHERQLAEAAETLRAREAAILAVHPSDDPLQADVVRRYAAATHFVEAMERALAAHGPMTAGFRSSRVLTPYLNLLDRVQRLSQQLREEKGGEAVPLAERLRAMFGAEEDR